MRLWDEVLPVVQAINDAAGNFTSIFLNCSVLDLLDAAAAAGDRNATMPRDRIVRAAQKGNWPQDPNAFNTILRTIMRAIVPSGKASRSAASTYIGEYKQDT